MKINFKTLPIGALPYNNIKLCKQMILRLFENIPYLPELPLLQPTDNLLDRTIENVPCISKVTGGLKFEVRHEILNQVLEIFDSFFDSGYEDIDAMSSSPYFMNDYLSMLKKLKPKETVIRLFGPFSLMQMIKNADIYDLLTEQTYRKYIVQAICLKAIWFIIQVKTVSAETEPIILFEEPLLHKFGSIRRANEAITKENLVSLYEKMIQKIHLAGGYVGVECFEKCNWQLVIDAGVNMISFDAYNNSTSLSIISDKINSFLASGGIINWAFIPVKSEKNLKYMKIDDLESRLVKAMGELACDGVHSELLFRHSTVSVLGDMHELPIIFAEKALILSRQLGQKIPKSFKVVQQDPQ